MRVVCPYEPDVHPITRASLDLHIPGRVEYLRVGPQVDAYWRLLCGLWAAQQGFLLIEHDMEIHERVYVAMLHCPQPWCAFPYPCVHPKYVAPTDDRLTYTALGCTRFRTSLLMKEPDLMATLGLAPGTPSHMVEMAHNWRGLDAHVISELMRRGYQVHTHWPEVVHHHDYPPGCACGQQHSEKLSG